MNWIDYSLIFGAYLLGSVSSAIIVCKLMGLPDPREQGSGNPGATNVLRIGGKKAAAVTLFGDMLKGFLPVLLAWFLQVEMLVLGLVGAAAFAGHLYPIFFKFQGGKGVATLLGVLLGFNSWVGLAGHRRHLAVHRQGTENLLPFGTDLDGTGTGLCLDLHGRPVGNHLHHPGYDPALLLASSQQHCAVVERGREPDREKILNCHFSISL